VKTAAVAIALLVLSFFSPPSRFLFYVRLALITALVMIASGCTPTPAQIVKTRDVEVTTYVREPIPADLIQDRIVVEPAPKCTLDGKPRLCNGQTATALQDYRDTLKQSNADKAALRELNAAQLNTSPSARPNTSGHTATPAADTSAAGQGSEHRP
jgi:hypothetical protein